MVTCAGTCIKHRKRCLVSIDPDAVKNSDYVNWKLCGRTERIKIKNGIIINSDHRHVCEDCLMEGG